MAEHLDLRTTLSQGAIMDYLSAHVPAGLAARLDVRDGCVATMLAVGNDVHTTFDEMAALYWLVRDGPFRYGPGHEYHATPDDLLQTWTCLYLGPPEDRRSGRRVLLAGDVLDDLAHNAVWRRTKRTLSRHGTWYYRKVRRDESTGVRGNPNGYQVACPNDTGFPFRVLEAGFSWEATTNCGRNLYRCPPCGMLFDLGAYDTPQYAGLARALASRPPP